MKKIEYIRKCLANVGVVRQQDLIIRRLLDTYNISNEKTFEWKKRHFAVMITVEGGNQLTFELVEFGKEKIVFDDLKMVEPLATEFGLGDWVTKPRLMGIRPDEEAYQIVKILHGSTYPHIHDGALKYTLANKRMTRVVSGKLNKASKKQINQTKLKQLF